MLLFKQEPYVSNLLLVHKIDYIYWISFIYKKVYSHSYFPSIR